VRREPVQLRTADARAAEFEPFVAVAAAIPADAETAKLPTRTQAAVVGVAIALTLAAVAAAVSTYAQAPQLPTRPATAPARAAVPFTITAESPAIPANVHPDLPVGLSR